MLFQQFRDDRRASKLEYRAIEIIGVKNKERKRLKQNEQSFCNLWDNIKGLSLCVIGVPEGKERENGAGEVFDELRTDSFPIMIRDLNL